MGLSTNTTTYTGESNVFPVNFALGYLDKSNVKVRVNNESINGVPLYRNFMWVNDSNIQIPAIDVGDIITISRNVPVDYLDVNFTISDNITKENIDRQSKQAIMLYHEIIDGRSGLNYTEEGYADTARHFSELAELYAERAEAAAGLVTSVPNTYYLEDFGGVGDGITDNATAWEAANDALELLGGGILRLVPNRVYLTTPVTIASNVTVDVNNATLAVHPDTPKTGNWLENRDISGDSTRIAKNIKIVGPGTLEGYNRPFDRWLSDLDGNPINDPQSDYVAGTGTLGLGISNVSLTSTVNNGQVTEVTINSGGAGWNGHPTYPYLSNDVSLSFIGDGQGAAGFATIVNGTLSSVTITESGEGYSSPPTVTPLGGYADIRLLTDPTVNRRNPNYVSSGSGIVFSKVDGPEISKLTIKGFRCRVISDAGSLNCKIHDNTFIDCGKNDGPFHLIWAQSFGNPAQGAVFFADTEGVSIKGNRASIGLERSFALFSPTKGGVMEDNIIYGAGESTVFITNKHCVNGGHSYIRKNIFSSNVLTDIAGELIEHGGARNLTISDNVLEKSALPAVVANGNFNVLYSNNRFINNYTKLSTSGNNTFPYGPYSERADFNYGSRPISGTNISNRGYVLRIGGFGDVGGENNRFIGNYFTDDRQSGSTSIFRQTRNSTIRECGYTEISGSTIDYVYPVDLLDTSSGNVWQSNIPLVIRDNFGHVSKNPVIKSHQISSTGTVHVDVGFRPAYVEVIAQVNNGSRNRNSIGYVSWTQDGTRNDFTHTESGADVGAIVGTELVRIINPDTGAISTSAEFLRWDELGFTFNVINYNELTNVRFICHP